MLSLAHALLLPPLFLVLHLLNQRLGRLRPLNAIPSAHPTAAFTPLWLLWVRYCKRENRTIWDCHKRLGPIVRLSPSEVSICSLQGVKTIYGDWDKTAWYTAFTNFGIPPLVAELDAAPHTVHKRRMGNVYSKSYLQNSQDISKFNTSILTEKVLPKIATSAATGASIDVLRLGFAYGMDVMSAYLFGSSYGTNHLDDDVAITGFAGAFNDLKVDFFWITRAPSLAKILQSVGINPISKATADAQDYLQDRCWELCSPVHTAVETGSVDPSSTAPVVYSQLYNSYAKDLEKSPPSPTNNPDYIRKAVASDMMDQLIAGYETTGIAMMYTMYHLSLNPAIQTALRAELRSLSPVLTFPVGSGSEDNAFSTSAPPSTICRALDAAPLLNAALYESMRLYPPGAAGQSRIVPRGGATLCGFPLPEGVVAHASPYSLHKNEDVYERAEEWIPERWMGDKKKVVGDWFWTFGSGSRGCIGKNFAIQEMLMFLATIYTNYSSHIAEAGDMDPIDDFIGGPKAGKLMLRFEKA